MNVREDIGGWYVFGPFRLDPLQRRLTRGDAELTVTPTVLDVLIHLVRNPGRVVTKDELLDAVWPGRIVEEANVKQAVFTLRKLLGADGERMIVTVPGRGYRFVEPVMPAGEVAQPHAPAAPQSPWRLAMWAAAACAVLAAGAGTAWFWRAPTPPVQSRAVVLADFENRTGDTVFDHALANLLRVDLSQSPFLNVISDAQTQHTLALMTRPRDTPVTVTLAEEICARNNADAVLRGGIASLDARYLLVLTATDCTGAHSFAAEKDEVDGKAAVAPALDRLIARVRARLGESDTSIAKFNVPLVGEQTASLEALKAFSEAQYVFNHGHPADAIPLDRHAIELDPKFSAAYSSLGVIYVALYDQKQATENISKAYALRDGINERARLGVTALYHQVVTGDFREAIRNFQVWTEIYPQDVIGWSNLANAEDYIGQHSQAIADGKRALALQPALANPYVVLARAELAAGQPDEGRAVAMLAKARGMAGDAVHRELLRIADARNDIHAVAQEEAWAGSVPTALRTQEVTAEIALSQGRVSAASALFDRISHALADRDTYDYMRPVQARLLAEMGYLDQAAQLLPAFKDGMAPDPDYLLAMARVGDAGRAEQLSQAWLRQTPNDTLLRNVFLPEARAFLALRRGDPNAAIAALQPAAPYEARSLDVPYLRGVACLAAGKGDQAAAAFQTVLDHRGWSPESVLYPLARLGLARARNLEHDTRSSADAYRAFLSEWRSADPDIPIYLEAKAEYAKIMKIIVLRH